MIYPVKPRMSGATIWNQETTEKKYLKREDDCSGGFVWLAIYSSIIQYGVSITLLLKITWYLLEQQDKIVELHGDYGETIIQHWKSLVPVSIGAKDSHGNEYDDQERPCRAHHPL